MSIHVVQTDPGLNQGNEWNVAVCVLGQWEQHGQGPCARGKERGTLEVPAGVVGAEEVGLEEGKQPG